VVWLCEGVSKVGNGIYVEGAGVGQGTGDADGRVKVPGELGRDGVAEPLPGVERDAVRDVIGEDSPAESSVNVLYGTAF
jgi:hypothetical protein